MSKLFHAMEKMPDTCTENGCLAHSSSGSANLNFFALAPAKRNELRGAISLFHDAFIEDKNLAMKNLFYLRDIRGGQGERSIFRECLVYLFQKLLKEHVSSQDVGIAKLRIVNAIPEYGRWDDIFYLFSNIEKPYNSDLLLDVVSLQLENDIYNMNENKPISLLAKWFPLEQNTKNPQKKKLARFLRKSIFFDPKKCRQTITRMRAYIDVCEQKMSAGEWSKLNYSRIPSKASLKYREAFKRNDKERYEGFLESLKKGETKINASTLYPYELVSKVRRGAGNDETIDQLWRHLPDYTNGKPAICVVDVSGSMLWFPIPGTEVYPLDVAVSLGIYFAERGKSIFRGKFITFSEEPSIQSIDPESTLQKKVQKMGRSPFGGSTNILGVFRLILDVAKKEELSQEDLPETVYIISDMEFDSCTSGTAYETIEKMYAESGYKKPNLVFWNVQSRNSHLPVRYDEHGTAMVSGCSPVVFKTVMEGKTPYEVMLDVLNSPRYAELNFF